MPPHLHRYRVQELSHTDWQNFAVALTEPNVRELIPIKPKAARKIHATFERERPRIESAAAAGFPVPDAIPFQIDEQESELA